MITLRTCDRLEFDLAYPWWRSVLSGWQGHSKPMSFYFSNGKGRK